jgi:hypothetical protein
MIVKNDARVLQKFCYETNRYVARLFLSRRIAIRSFSNQPIDPAKRIPVVRMQIIAPSCLQIHLPEVVLPGLVGQFEGCDSSTSATFFVSSTNSSISYPPSQSIHQSINQSINQSMIPSINHPITPSINQSITPSISQSLHQSINHSINQSINHQSITPSINQSLHQSINQSRNQSIHQLINPSINESIIHSFNQSQINALQFLRSQGIC